MKVVLKLFQNVKDFISKLTHFHAQSTWGLEGGLHRIVTISTKKKKKPKIVH